MDQRVDRAAQIQQRGPRGGPAEIDGVQPGTMAVRPCRPVIEAMAVAQQQLAQPVTLAHQIDADRFSGADEIAQRLLLVAGHADRLQLAGQQQPDEVLGVAAVGLHAVPRRARDLARRRDHAVHAAPGELARQSVPGRPRLIGGTDRTGQPGAQPGRLGRVTTHREPRQFPGLRVEHRRHDLRGVHVQTDESSSLRHGRFLLCGCGSQRGASRAAETSPHDRNGGPAPSTTGAGQTIHMV